MDQKVTRGSGGEIHQVAENGVSQLTTQQGVPVADDQNFLKMEVAVQQLSRTFIFAKRFSTSITNEFRSESFTPAASGHMAISKTMNRYPYYASGTISAQARELPRLCGFLP